MTPLRLDADTYPRHRDSLATLLCATVQAGGAVGFMHPLSRRDALSFWDRHASGLANGTLDMLVAIAGRSVIGTVSLDCALPPNQSHRGDICKMMVAPQYRRHGVAKGLMAAVETEATRRGLSLLVLDTRTGDEAQKLYTQAGFKVAGEIPDYARDPDGATLHGTTLMYRRL